MMSQGAKRIEASNLRSCVLVEEFDLDHARADGNNEHDTSATEDGQECRGVPPTWCAHTERICAPAPPKRNHRDGIKPEPGCEGGPKRFETLLQFKGFS